jgi:hypothetical protein
MAKSTQKLKGTVTLYSNSPGQPTGYGVQAQVLIEQMKRAGLDVAAQSNYGLEGNRSTYRTAYGEIPHYARGSDPYSNDVAPMNHAHWKSLNGDQPDLLLGLYDCWVIKGKAWDKHPVAWWTPLDHVTMPPMVEEFLRKENVTPIAMSPFGVRQMESKGIACEYVPHVVDTKVFKPTATIGGQPGREYLGVKDQFVIGMNAANKASGLIHRKAFSENLLAFSIFRQSHPDAVLYLHTDPLGSAGGWNLITMVQAFGIPKEAVLFAPFIDYKYGISNTDLAGLYSTMDVFLAPSFGEGFGVPTIEAQACGVRTIGSNWAATPDLVSDDSWLVEGQPTWDASQSSFWQVPLVPSIVAALEEAYKAERGVSKKSVEFAQQFDSETVWQNHWLPTLTKLLKR